MKTLTTANSSLFLQITGLYPIPQKIEGFAMDEAFATDDVTTAETQMGVDGRLSSGYTPYPVSLKIVLQADSPSMSIFDNLIAAQDAANEVYRIDASALLQGTGDKYAFIKGTLTKFTPMSESKKILQPRTFEFVFESKTKSPV
jgi:hypothetical protein